MLKDRDFITRLSNYLRARFAFLSISTWEESRVISDIRRICEDENIIKTKRNLYTWSVTDGLVSETGKSNARLRKSNDREARKKYSNGASRAICDKHRLIFRWKCKPGK
ncbi:hypothetical protein [Pseudogracilibacillus sp. ICA-222130]|uniref:hypothetical protein n=1 Tax=Pseudogracilibacillus sp. ICA-222130 TaxID=3134655 RepID=UPI0030C56A0E